MHSKKKHKNGAPNGIILFETYLVAHSSFFFQLPGTGIGNRIQNSARIPAEF